MSRWSSPPARTRPPTRPLAAHLLRRHPRPQGGRHRLRLRRLPGRRRALSRRPAGRGLAGGGRRDRRTTRSIPERGPQGRRQLPVRRRHQRHGRRDVQAVALAGVPRPASCRSPSSTTKSSRQLAARADRPRQLKAMHIDPTRSPTRPACSILMSTDAILREPPTCAGGSPPKSMILIRNVPPSLNAANSANSRRRRAAGPGSRWSDRRRAGAWRQAGQGPRRCIREPADRRRRCLPRRRRRRPAWLDKIIADGLTPTVPTDYQRWQPLHWILAVPDVMERGGFDAIIGNPPFLGGQKLTGTMGTNVRDWFVNVARRGQRGKRRPCRLLLPPRASACYAAGNLGLIATNTVAQGDTREVGLDRWWPAGFTITRSIQSRSWPAASVNLEYAAVWGTCEPVADDVAASRGRPPVSSGSRPCLSPPAA